MESFVHADNFSDDIQMEHGDGPFMSVPMCLLSETWGQTQKDRPHVPPFPRSTSQKISKAPGAEILKSHPIVIQHIIPVVLFDICVEIKPFHSDVFQMLPVEHAAFLHRPPLKKSIEIAVGYPVNRKLPGEKLPAA